MTWYQYLLEYNRYCNLIGIFFILFIAILFSRKRAAINYKLIVNGLILQFVLAYLVLRTTIGHSIIAAVAEVVKKLYVCADQGASFLFGNLANANTPWGFIFAIKVLPIIIFFGALMALLFHWGIVQKCVYAVSLLVRPVLGTSGAETLCAIANSFLGQTEAPLLIRNYLKNMTRSELLVVMISGMGTISGAILAVFAAMGVPAEHLLSASVMAIPGTILIAKILYPETEETHTGTNVQIEYEGETKNIFDAISTGTTDGLYLALNVGAMLISFLSLLALVNLSLEQIAIYINAGLAYVAIPFQLPTLNLSIIFSYLFAPFGYLLGFTGTEALKAGELLGIKVTVNELVAYAQMLDMHLSERAISILTYALCGFSNFSCIGIQIGGIGALVPEKRQWLCEFGLLTVLGSSLSNLLSAMIAGLLL
ncbi:MAG: nucleoside transporter C-terminal domain-containing protein [Candidatus Babeliales bacterium]